MLRNAAMASSAFRRLVFSTSRHTLLSPAMSTAISAIPRRAVLQPNLISAHQLFAPALLSQFRGFARGSRSIAPSEDEDADLTEGEAEFSGAEFDDKYLSDGEEILDTEDEDDDDDQLE